MSKKAKGKASANSTAKAATAKQATTPAKPAPAPPKPPTPVAVAPPPPPPPAPAPAPTPVPKATPPAPKPAPPKIEPPKSQKLRKEWQALETWLKVHRAERDKKLNEARAKAKPATTSRYNRSGLSARAAPSNPPVDLSALRLKLDTELATSARAEWERRLAASKLNEEDWVDITPEEMKAVEDAFTIPEEPSKPTDQQPNLSSGNPSAVNLNNTNSNSFTTSPGGWTVHPSALPTASGSGLRRNEQPKNPFDTWGQPAPSHPEAPTESLWNMAAKNGNLSSSSASSNTAPNPPKANPPGPIKPSNSASTATTESLWSIGMKGKLGTAQYPSNPSPNPRPTDPLLRPMNGFPSAQQNNVPEETLWEKVSKTGSTGGAKENQPFTAVPTSREPSVDRWGFPLWDPEESQVPQVPQVQEPTFESFWESKLALGGKTSSNKPTRSSPLATAEPLTSESSSETQFGLRCPSLIEAEYGETLHADEKGPGLTMKMMEESIRKFYSLAAEREIQLRKKLTSSSRSAEADIFRAQMVEEFVQSVDNEARSVFDGWVATRLEAEEKQKAAHARTLSAQTRTIPASAASKRPNIASTSASVSVPTTTISSSSAAAQAKASASKLNTVQGKKQLKKTTVVNGKKKDDGPILEEIKPAEPPVVVQAEVKKETAKKETAPPPRAGTPISSSSAKAQAGRPSSPWATGPQKAQKNKVSFASPLISSANEKVTFPTRAGTPRASTPVQTKPIAPTPIRPSPLSQNKAKNPFQAYVSDEADEDAEEGEEEEEDSSSITSSDDGLTTPEGESSEGSTSPTVAPPSWHWMSERAAGKQPASTSFFSHPPRERKYSSASDPRNLGNVPVQNAFAPQTAFWRPSMPGGNGGGVTHNPPMSRAGGFSSQAVAPSNELQDLAMQNLFEAANRGDDIVNAMAMFAGLNSAPNRSQPGRNPSRFR